MDRILRVVSTAVMFLGVCMLTFVVYMLVWGIRAQSDEEWCDRPYPIFYEVGEQAVFVRTGETVRIELKYKLWGTGQCEKDRYSVYDVRFSDGASIKASWIDLKKIGRE